MNTRRYSGIQTAARQRHDSRRISTGNDKGQPRVYIGLGGGVVDRVGYGSGLALKKIASVPEGEFSHSLVH
jgi:hypothetical protein